MVEFSVGPQHRVVTGVAGGGESCGDVVHRRDGVVVVRLVTGNAGCAGDVVVVVDVTIATLTRRRSVRTGQCESRAVVVKRRIEPR